MKIEDILSKFDNGEELTEREIREVIEYGISEDCGEDRRWSRTVSVLSKINDRYFYTEYEEGLTENQEDEYDNQPTEVFKEPDYIEVIRYKISDYMTKDRKCLFSKKVKIDVPIV